MVKRFPNGSTFYVCDRCIKPKDLAAAMPTSGARGFMYDPVSDTLLSRPRARGSELNRFDCACGWIVVDAGKAYMVSIAKHRQSCPEGGRPLERGGDGD